MTIRQKERSPQRYDSQSLYPNSDEEEIYRANSPEVDEYGASAAEVEESIFLSYQEFSQALDQYQLNALNNGEIESQSRAQDINLLRRMVFDKEILIGKGSQEEVMGQIEDLLIQMSAQDPIGFPQQPPQQPFRQEPELGLALAPNAQEQPQQPQQNLIRDLETQIQQKKQDISDKKESLFFKSMGMFFLLSMALVTLYLLSKNLPSLLASGSEYATGYGVLSGILVVLFPAGAFLMGNEAARNMRQIADLKKDLNELQEVQQDQQQQQAAQQEPEPNIPYIQHLQQTRAHGNRVGVNPVSARRTLQEEREIGETRV